MKTYLVFGAAGSIGEEVVVRLLAKNHTVFSSVRVHHQEETGRQVVKSHNHGMDVTNDVSIRQEMEMCAYRLHTRLQSYPNRIPSAKLDGVIYAIGHCPPGGFAEAVKYPLSKLPQETYQREIEMHQLGVLNVFQLMLPHVAGGGCFIFLSSAITRTRKFPPAMHAHYHASVIAAEDWLIEGMRHDPEVRERKIKIHRLAPAAVDTPFHRNHDGPKPPRLIPISQVVDEILRALESPKHVDRNFL